MEEKLRGKCPLCDERVDFHDGSDNGKHASWHLRRERGRIPTLHVTLESKPLGIALADELVVYFCPICGKDLRGQEEEGTQ